MNTNDCKKSQRVFHVNMLWKYYISAETSLLAEEVPDTDAEDIPTRNKMQMSDGEPQIAKKLTDEQQTQLVQLLTEYSRVVMETPGRTNMVEHHILTGDAHPIRLPAYRSTYYLSKCCKSRTDNMLKEGINEPATSPWSSPIVLVNKKDKSLRLCVEKTAFITSFGLYQFHVMLFGLQGAPATFQRLMNQVLQGFEDFSAAYLDDIIVFSETWNDHLQHLPRYWSL